jgi:hypothetical protein
MVDRTVECRENMLAEGCTEEYLDKWMDSLTSRVEIQKIHKVFAWGIFISRIDGPVY